MGSSRSLKFWRPASQNRFYLSDIERFLRIIQKEKWLGQTGVESLQKMSIALLKTIESKNMLIETLTLENKTRGSRLQSLVRHCVDDDDAAETVPPREAEKRQLLQPDCLTTPPEIEFEQPHRTPAPDDVLISITNVNLKRRNKRC